MLSNPSTQRWSSPLLLALLAGAVLLTAIQPTVGPMLLILAGVSVALLSGSASGPGWLAIGLAVAAAAFCLQPWSMGAAGHASIPAFLPPAAFLALPLAWLTGAGLLSLRHQAPQEPALLRALTAEDLLVLDGGEEPALEFPELLELPEAA